MLSALETAPTRLGYTLWDRQRKIASEFVHGRDAFMSLPAGSGKTLCYCRLWTARTTHKRTPQTYHKPLMDLQLRVDYIPQYFPVHSHHAHARIVTAGLNAKHTRRAVELHSRHIPPGSYWLGQRRPMITASSEPAAADLGCWWTDYPWQPGRRGQEQVIRLPGPEGVTFTRTSPAEGSHGLTLLPSTFSLSW